MALMNIKNLNGEIIYEGYANTQMELVEDAVRNSANLSYANLAGIQLVEACLDRGHFSGACFEGSNLLGANMAECLLNDCDFKFARLSDTCLAHSSMDMCDFDGTTFSSSTIITGVDFSRCYFNCSSLFSLKLREAQSTHNAVYSHLDLIDCPISHPPIVICGLPYHLVFMDQHLKINSDVRKLEDWLKTNEDEFIFKYGKTIHHLVWHSQFGDTISS